MQVSSRIFFLFLLVLGIFALYVRECSFAKSTHLFVTAIACLSIAMIGLFKTWPKGGGKNYIIVMAALLRCALLPLPASDDVNRYIWEGKMQVYGLNPYKISPNAPETIPLRDNLWDKINHKNVATAYGPIAQLFFRGIFSLYPSPLLFKFFLTIADMGTLLLLLSILTIRKKNYRMALLYAINPLILYSFAVEGHIDCLLVFFVAGACLAYCKDKYGIMYLLFGCAVAIKPSAIIYLPFFMGRNNIFFLYYLIIPAISVLPFGSAFFSHLSVLTRFAADFHFNGCFYNILAPLLGAKTTLPILMVLFCTAYSFVFFLCPDPIRACGWATLSLLLCLPTAHPWYFTLLAFFSALYPEPLWICLSCTATFSWVTIFKFWRTGLWMEKSYVSLTEYAIPFLAHLCKFRFQKSFLKSTTPESEITGISIIVPTLNEQASINKCLKSIILPPLPLHSEIIVADGSSCDNTRAIAVADKRVRVVDSEKGRGKQISHALSHARGELIVIVHSDCTLCKDAILRILNFCNEYPFYAGGCGASCFDSSAFRYRITGFLNNLRSRSTGIAFGDQVQFFRRSYLEKGFPAVALMEDIELSLLLKEHADVVTLGKLGISSIRRWEKHKWHKNTIHILWLTVIYLFRRRLGLLAADNQDFYRRYYGKK